MSATGPDGPSTAAGGQRTATSSLRDLAIAISLAIAAFAVFNANGRLISAADTFAARYLPFSVLRHHSVLLDPVAGSVALGHAAPAAVGASGTAFWIERVRGGHLVSKFSVVLPLVVAPLYLPAAYYLDRVAWDAHIADKVARIMEKLCASLIACVSVGMLYLLLRRRCDPRTAAALSLVFAFGTTTWMISSQALWVHGLAQLLIIATMWLITGPATPARAALAGALCALIVANRPPDAVLAAALGLWALRWAGRSWAAFVLAGAVPAALTLAYNLGGVGHVAGAYALNVYPANFNHNIAEGIAGLLFSPTRGLFVFSPFLLFVPCLLSRALRAGGERGLTLLLCAAMAAQVAGYAMIDWRQGVSWGPRWLTDMLPLLMWMLPPIVASLSRKARVVFAACCAASIAIELVGAFWYTGAAETAIYAAQGGDRMRPMWEVRNAAFVAELAHPRAAPDLFTNLRGHLDVVESHEVAVYDAAGGDRLERQLEVAGWALADAHTPEDIALMIDGREAVGTGYFAARADVARVMGTGSPAGWYLSAPVGDLKPGRHSLAVVVRAYPGSELRLLGERAFDLPPVPAGDLAARLLDYAARRAAGRIASGQQAPGYWLTRFTGSTRFERPGQELNTYLNALMLDIAAPIAVEAGMEQPLARARAFLARQIEDDGLVRYHGRPDAPTIGALGCAITPDADDTALAWRVAPRAERDKLAAALRAMRRFRTADGLYRTWLAQRADYQCLDPGADPNPADIGIQMHVYMLLAREDPAAARALCRALARRVDDPAVWVYYAAAPAVVNLRLADLRQAGCALDIPASRLQPVNAAQAVWARVAALAARLREYPPAAALQAEAARLLRQLASRDFAALAADPPLLYHNDMSATVRRYYWSPEAGYLLWLRLYYAVRKAAPASAPAASDAGSDAS